MNQNSAELQRFLQLFTQFSALISCKDRAVSKCDKHHIHLDNRYDSMVILDTGYWILYPSL